MSDIYAYNPKVKYTPKNWSGGGINLSKNRIYVNNKQYFDFHFHDIFEDYKIIRNKDEWSISLTLVKQLRGRPPKLYEYFHMYRCQLNFAIFCATSALGISIQHLTKGSELLKSIYKFHVFYHIRRIFKLMGSPTPNQDQFVKWNNPFSTTGYHNVCFKYGVNPDNVWLAGKWFYSTQGLFIHDGKEATKYTHFSNDYSRWIMPKSEGLTYEALNLLSDSVRAYVYLLLASQASAERDILNSPGAKSIYIDDLEDIIARPVDTADDIKRYENVLNKARSKVDFAIAEQVYMLPSDMLLKIGDIEGYNNNLLIANNSVKIGVVNQSVNANVKHVIKSPIIHKKHIGPTKGVSSTLSMLPEKDKKLAVDHIEEKEVLIITGISLILLGWWFL